MWQETHVLAFSESYTLENKFFHKSPATGIVTLTSYWNEVEKATTPNFFGEQWYYSRDFFSYV